ncbi:MAG: GntP family permease [Brevinema sp.]
MEFTVSYIGAIVGLLVAIICIIYKVAPVYSLIFGAILGSLVGGVSLPQTVTLIISGSAGMISAIIRILTAGILVGVLIKTGVATRIGLSIIQLFGEKNILGVFFALVLAGMVLTAVGVFIDITVITLAPIVLNIAKQIKLSCSAILLALIGGGKAGNMISPNPNTIIGAEAFNLDLLTLIKANLIPSLVAMICTVFIAYTMNKVFKDIVDDSDQVEDRALPSLFTACIAPIVAVFLLILRPFSGVVVDPLIALPVGSFISCLAIGKIKELGAGMKIGLERMGGVALLLLGTGAIARVVKGSDLTQIFASTLQNIGLSVNFIAPLAGVLMSFATASTTAGTVVASTTFGPILMDLGVNPIAAAATIHTGATVLDHVPHGSFFHATTGAVNMKFRSRLSLIPFESLVGLILTSVSWLIYFVIL